MFLVSVDSEGFRFAVSCLESTLVGWFVSVAFKGVRAERAGGQECESVKVEECKSRQRGSGMRTRGPYRVWPQSGQHRVWPQSGRPGEERTWVAPESWDGNEKAPVKPGRSTEQKNYMG